MHIPRDPDAPLNRTRRALCGKAGRVEIHLEDVYDLLDPHMCRSCALLQLDVRDFNTLVKDPDLLSSLRASLSATDAAKSHVVPTHRTISDSPDRIYEVDY